MTHILELADFKPRHRAVLEAIGNGSATPGAIAAAIDKTPGAVSRILFDLTEGGAVAYRGADGHRRYEVSPGGRDLLERDEFAQNRVEGVPVEAGL